MVSVSELDADELDALARIAQGQGASVAGHRVDRLLDIGLVARVAGVEGAHARLELTSAGLALIRSSDQ